MSSLTMPPARIKLFKAVERAFVDAGWTIERKKVENNDFRVSAQNIEFRLKCLDESRIAYESPSTIVAKLEGYARVHRNLGNRQLIVILDRNFLGIPLDGLIDREIFAVTLDDLSPITNLSQVSNDIPNVADARQNYLLTHCVDYTLFVSKKCLANGDILEAIVWARLAVQYTVGFSYAYYHLFGLLKEAKDYDSAAEIGQRIVGYRPDDPQILRGMADLARRRGNQAEAKRWVGRLTDRPTAPRSFEAIMSKQRREKKETVGQQEVRPHPDIPDRTSGLSRVLNRLLRPSRGRS